MRFLAAGGRRAERFITSSPKVGDVDPVKFPEVPKPAAKRLGDAEYPLALSGTGTNLAVLNGCADGVIKACSSTTPTPCRGMRSRQSGARRFPGKSLW